MRLRFFHGRVTKILFLVRNQFWGFEFRLCRATIGSGTNCVLVSNHFPRYPFLSNLFVVGNLKGRQHL